MKKTVHIEPGLLSGTVELPPSKSIAHRLLFIEGIARLMGTGKRSKANHLIENELPFEARDIKETRRSIEALLEGASEFSCKESAASYRFLVPTLAFLLLRKARDGNDQGSVEIKIGPALVRRPTEPLFNSLRSFGFDVELKENILRIGLTENLIKKHYEEGSTSSFVLPGKMSSQFASGLVMALPLIDGGELTIVGMQVSMPYLDMTLRLMERCGIKAEKQFHANNNITIKVDTRARYSLPTDLEVEGDASSAAFWLVANKLGSNIKILNLPKSDLQGDSRLENILATSGDMAPLAIDLTDSPDLAPPLSIYGCFRSGGIVLEGCSRLRYKETDRIHAIVDMINSLGGQARIEDDGERIFVAGKPLVGGKIDASKDHRIAMAAAIAATRCSKGLTITGAESVAKSYPKFWDDLKSLGGDFEVCN